MREKKDSGVAWVKDIPFDWNIAYLSSILAERKNKNVGMQENNLLSLSYGKVKRKDISTSDGLLPESFEGYNIIEKDDIVLRLTDLQNDHRSLRTGLCKERGIITSAYCTLKTNSNFSDSRYLHYYLHSFDVCKGFYGMGAGVRQGLNYDGIRKIEMVVPPLPEQRRIADHLDTACSKVDALIANQQAQIEKLKAYKQSLITEVVTHGLDPDTPMKDSGVEWIGMVPEGWKKSRIKHIALFDPKCNTEHITADSVIGYAPMDCIKNGYFIPKEARYGDVSASLTSFENGDVVIAKVTPCFENGNIAIMNNLPSGYGLGSSELFVLRAKKTNTRFLLYWLQNIGFINAGRATMTGTGGLKRVSPNFIKSCPIYMPSETEQQQIAEYLDDKCAKIDALIAIKQQKIEKLTQYKKSLIYEYVTGKKEAI